MDQNLVKIDQNMVKGDQNLIKVDQNLIKGDQNLIKENQNLVKVQCTGRLKSSQNQVTSCFLKITLGPHFQNFQFMNNIVHKLQHPLQDILHSIKLEQQRTLPDEKVIT